MIGSGGRRTDVNFGFNAAPKTDAAAWIWFVVTWLPIVAS